MKKILDFISPKSRKNEVVSFVKSGLKDLSISRKAFPGVSKFPIILIMLYMFGLMLLTNYISALKLS